MGYEHRGEAVGVGGASNAKHTLTQCLRDTQGGWILGRRSDAILTHVGMAPL